MSRYVVPRSSTKGTRHKEPMTLEEARKRYGAVEVRVLEARNSVFQIRPASKADEIFLARWVKIDRPPGRKPYYFPPRPTGAQSPAIRRRWKRQARRLSAVLTRALMA